jgi:type I restriction enzyme S subunit
MNAPGNEVRLSTAANSVDDGTLRAIGAKAWPTGTVVFPKVGAALLTEKRRVLGLRSAFDNNVMGLVPGPHLSSRYLYWFMTTVRLAEFAQTGALPSVNQGHIARLLIPVPPLDRQRQVVDLADAMQEVVLASARVAEAADGSRSEVLKSLMGGAQSIPASYDRFLKGAA